MILYTYIVKCAKLLVSHKIPKISRLQKMPNNTSGLFPFTYENISALILWDALKCKGKDVPML
jgi:hypothetical protein